MKVVHPPPLFFMKKKCNLARTALFKWPDHLHLPSVKTLHKSHFKVPKLQPRLVNSLLERLLEFSVDDHDDSVRSLEDDDAPDLSSMPRLILSQLRWLERIVQPIELVRTSFGCCGGVWIYIFPFFLFSPLPLPYPFPVRDLAADVESTPPPPH